MSTTPIVDSAETHETTGIIVCPQPGADEEVTKYTMRKAIWTTFDKNGLVAFPRPCKGRMPNFRGQVEAAERLKETDIFKKATVVKVNIDKPQEAVRQHVLQEKKRLVMSPRRLETVSLLDVQLPAELSPSILKTAATRFGVMTYGQSLPIDTPVRLDLLVVGSVAVSRKGQRIGKCDGYSDLEFAFLTEIGIINEQTVIATTVHDSQVYDSLPDELFQAHDFPVDLIVTPTQVIEVNPRMARPPGIIWPLLSKRRMNLLPNIVAHQQKCIENGKECHLKEEDTDDEVERDIRAKHRPVYRFRRYGKNMENRKQNEKGDAGNEEKEGKYENRRGPRKATDNDSKGDGKNKWQMRRRFRPWRPCPIVFSLKIGGITSTDRVRDLKNALAARNVKPADISWFGHRGFAFVHFAKPRKTVETPFDLDSVVAQLKDMKLGPEEECKEKAALIVERASKSSSDPTPTPPTPTQAQEIEKKLAALQSDNSSISMPLPTVAV